MTYLKKIGRKVGAVALAVVMAVGSFPTGGTFVEAASTTIQKLDQQSPPDDAVTNYVGLALPSNLDVKTSVADSKTKLTKASDSSWVWKEQTTAEKSKLGDAYIATLTASGSYSMTYKNVTFEEDANKTKYDVKVTFSAAEGKKSNAQGYDIAIFTKQLGAVRFRGYKSLKCTIYVYKAGTTELERDSSKIKFRLRFIDIDCNQSVESLSPGRTEWSAVGSKIQYITSARAKTTGATVGNTVSCYSTKDVNDTWIQGTAAQKKEAEKYAWALGFRPVADTTMSSTYVMRYYIGGTEPGAQTNGAFFSFDGKIDVTQTSQDTLKSANLTIDKVADQYEYKVGDTVTYTITTKNSSADTTANSVEVTDEIPEELKVESVSTTGGTNTTSSFSGQDITVRAESLEAGASLVTTVTCSALKAGNGNELYNEATATLDNGQNGKESTDDDAETYINSSDLRIDKVSDKYEYQVGDTANFTIKVKNEAGMAKNVEITDTLPDGFALKYDSVSISGLPTSVDLHVAGTKDPTNELNKDLMDETEEASVTAKKSKTGDSGFAYHINYMPSDTTVTITYSATVTNGANGDEVQNIASATSDNNLVEKVFDDAEVYVNTASLSIEKSVVNPYKDEKKDNREENEFRVYEEATGKEVVQYKVVITSDGANGTVAKDVVVNDTTLPEGLVLNFDSVKAVVTDANGEELKDIKYHIAGTADNTNQLDPDFYHETENRDASVSVEQSGNGFVAKSSFLPAGAKIVITYSAQATETVNGSEVRNVASATASNLEEDEDGKTPELKDDAVVYINSPRLKITKDASGKEHKIGDTVTYTVNVTNEKTGTVARNLVLTDVIETEGVELQGATIALKDASGKVIEVIKTDIDGNSFVIETGKHLVVNGNYNLFDTTSSKIPEAQSKWNPVDVTSETSMQITYDMVITDENLAGKEIVNTATAVSDEALKVTTDKTITPIPPELIIEKTADKKAYYVNEAANYSITVTQNEESVKATDVVIKDQLMDGNYAVIDTDSLKVALNGNDITGDVKVAFNESKDGFIITTGKSLASSDTMVVTYKATFNEEAVGMELSNTALTWGGNAPEVSSMETVTVEEVPPVLTIEKTSDKAVYSVGDTGKYTVTVSQNVDDAIARNVVISDALNVTGVVVSGITVTDKDGNNITSEVVMDATENQYTISTGKDLAKGETFVVTYDVFFKEAGLAGSTVKNTAKADADNTDEVEEDNEVEIVTPDVIPTKTSDKKLYEMSEIAHYTLTAKNEKEDSTARNVVITDELLMDGVSYVEGSIKVADTDGNDVTEKMKSIEIDGSTFEIQTGKHLKYNELFTVTYDVTFDDTSVIGQAIPNVTKVFGDNFSVSADNEVAIPNTDLTAVKSATPVSGSTVNTGDEITYNITVTNNGESDIEGVMIRDRIPELTEYVSGGEVRTIDEKSYVTFVIDSLKAGESKTESFVVKVTGEGYAVVRNTAEVKVAKDSDDWNDGFTKTNTVVHYIPNIVNVETPELTIDKSSDKEAYDVKETAKYTVVVGQTKEDMVARDIVIKDALKDDGATIVEGSVKLVDTEGKDITSDVTIVLNEDKKGYQIDTGRNLAYNETFTVTYDVTFTKDAVDKDVLNIAKAKGSNVEVLAKNEVTPVTYTDEDGNEIFEIVKNADPEAGTKVKVGDKITYTITTKNLSKNALTNVQVKDMIPEGTSFVSAENGEVKELEKGSYVTFVISSIPAGESATSTFVVKVEETAADMVTNTANVKVAGDVEALDWSDDGFIDTNTITHPLGEVWVTDDNTVTVVDNTKPELAIKKQSDKDIYAVGETGTYTVTVTNTTKDSVAKNIVINDTLDTKGVKIVADSVQIANTNGNDITSEVEVESADLGYTIKTGKNLAFGEKFVVTYQVLFEAETLVGKTITNVAEAKGDNTDSVRDEKEVNVDDGTAPRLVVTKKSDKETYNVGDKAVYTITLTNDREGTTAENVVITDAFEVTGMTVDADSITLKDSDGKALKASKITVNSDKNGYTMETGNNLESGKTWTITYNVTFTDQTLAGKSVINNVTATSDNTDPAKTKHTVSIKKDTTSAPTDGGKGNRTQETGGSNKTASPVKTSDVLIVLLAGAVAILVGAVIYKKKKAVK